MLRAAAAAPMRVADIVRTVVQQFEAAGADYQIVGAIAYFLYGPPRFTGDVDFVVRAQLVERAGGTRLRFRRLNDPAKFPSLTPG